MQQDNKVFKRELEDGKLQVKKKLVSGKWNICGGRECTQLIPRNHRFCLNCRKKRFKEMKVDVNNNDLQNIRDNYNFTDGDISRNNGLCYACGTKSYGTYCKWCKQIQHLEWLCLNTMNKHITLFRSNKKELDDLDIKYILERQKACILNIDKANIRIAMIKILQTKLDLIIKRIKTEKNVNVRIEKLINKS